MSRIREAGDSPFSFFEFAPALSTSHLNKVRVRYGPGQIETKGGGGVWETVKRPYREPLTVWRGASEAYQHKIPAVIDGFIDEEECGPTKRTIELMAGVLNGNVEPPRLTLDGYGAIEHDATNDPTLSWIIPEPPEWGEMVRREDGVLIRQAFVITFALYTSDQELRRPAPPRPSSIVIHAKRGDTFESIAAHRLHHAHWGGLLAKLNEQTSATHQLSAGQEVFLPDEKQRREWARSTSHR
jgi:hypothetical protein